jgi:hypothetical protein
MLRALYTQQEDLSSLPVPTRDSHSLTPDPARNCNVWYIVDGKYLPNGRRKKSQVCNITLSDFSEYLPWFRYVHE